MGENRQAEVKEKSGLNAHAVQKEQVKGKGVTLAERKEEEIEKSTQQKASAESI